MRYKEFNETTQTASQVLRALGFDVPALPELPSLPDAPKFGSNDNSKGGVKPTLAATPKKSLPVGNNLTNDENSQRAQDASEKFLGRKIEGNEWNYLIRAIYAESTSNQKEIAYVAAVMLNRTRSGKWGRSIIDVLTAKNQFQAVTGTKADGHSASRNFTQGPGKGSLSNIYKALIDILPSAPKDILRFTAANRKAYGAGTNVRYLDQLIAQGGRQIGGTVFA